MMREAAVRLRRFTAKSTRPIPVNPSHRSPQSSQPDKTTPGLPLRGFAVVSARLVSHRARLRVHVGPGTRTLVLERVVVHFSAWPVSVWRHQVGCSRFSDCGFTHTFIRSEENTASKSAATSRETKCCPSQLWPEPTPSQRLINVQNLLHTGEFSAFIEAWINKFTANSSTPSSSLREVTPF